MELGTQKFYIKKNNLCGQIVTYFGGKPSNHSISQTFFYQ